MPSTHSSLHYHLVFSTKGRKPSIPFDASERLHAYLGGIVTRLGGIPLDIGGVADHVHLVVGLKTTHTVADFVRVVKTDSSRWMHEALKVEGFGWQEGYGIFAVSGSDLASLRQYVRSQAEHHRRRTFQEEYLDFLEQYGVEFDHRYLW